MSYTTVVFLNFTCFNTFVNTTSLVSLGNLQAIVMCKPLNMLLRLTASGVVRIQDKNVTPV